MEESLDLVLSGGLQKDVGPEEIGLKEFPGAENGAVHVAFRGEMHHRLRILHAGIHGPAVEDVSPDPLVSFVPGKVLEVFRIPRVGFFIQVEDLVGGVFVQEVADEIGADEPQPSGNQELHGEKYPQVFSRPWAKLKRGRYPKIRLAWEMSAQVLRTSPARLGVWRLGSFFFMIFSSPRMRSKRE